MTKRPSVLQWEGDLSLFYKKDTFSTSMWSRPSALSLWEDLSCSCLRRSLLLLSEKTFFSSLRRPSGSSRFFHFSIYLLRLDNCFYTHFIVVVVVCIQLQTIRSIVITIVVVTFVILACYYCCWWVLQKWISREFIIPQWPQCHRSGIRLQQPPAMETTGHQTDPFGTEL